MFLIICLYFIIALTFVFAKNAVLSTSPLFFTAIRMVCAGVLLHSAAYIKTKKITIPIHTDLFLFSLITLLHIYIPFSGEFWALTRLNALKVNFLFSLTPFFAVTIQAFLNHRLPNIKTISGIIIGFCALMFLLIIQDQSSVQQYANIIFSFSTAEFVLLIAVISSTIAWFLITTAIEKQYTITIINAWSMLIGGFAILLSSLLFEAIIIRDTYEFIKNLVLLIVFSNVIFYNLYGILLKRYSITLLTTAGFLSPLFGMIFESIIQKTFPDPLYFISLFFVFVGLFLMQEKN